MPITWLERYNASEQWHEKCLIMALYHQTMKHNFANRWTMGETAEYFCCSIGLVSENIKLSNAIDRDNRYTNCKTRQEALAKMKTAWIK